LAGYVRLGSSLKIGYFAQVRTDLDPDRSILDTILEVKNLPIGEARSYLARFLFSGDEVFKRIGELSGGEQSRVALAKLVLLRANFLLLDEPTNHLDIASQEVLEEVLDEFPGTILLVTHDRYLVDRLATQLWLIQPRERDLEVFSGTWAEYTELSAGEESEERTREARGKWSTDQRQARREEQRARREKEAREQRATELESEIYRLEEELDRLQDEITAASRAQEAMRIHELGTIYAHLERQLQETLSQWAELAAS
jgi:ATP-binding cassette subfamily F protein 3